MTVLKTSALVAALVGAAAIGVVARPYIIHDRPADSIAAAPATPAEDSRPAKVVKAPAPSVAVVRASNVTIAQVTPALQDRVKHLLKSGTDMDIAADGFTKAEDFAAVAHAANNCDIPFVLLKHRLLDEHMTLARAIQTSRPMIAADVEANRARAEARADVAATTSWPQ
jgi:hypothetical protein